MLALTGALKIWHICGVTDMRLGKYRLFGIAGEKFPNPYKGDCFAFMSKNRRTLKIVRYEHHQIILYDISYERGYKFMKPVYLSVSPRLKNTPAKVISNVPVIRF